MTDSAAPLGRPARSRALLLPLLVVVALVVALLVPIVIHRSITSESLFAGGTFDRFPGERVEQQLGDDRPQVMVVYRQGEEYSFDFRLSNESRWATRILEFPGSGSALLRRTSVDLATVIHVPVPEACPER